MCQSADRCEMASAKHWVYLRPRLPRRQRQPWSTRATNSPELTRGVLSPDSGVFRRRSAVSRLAHW